MVQKGTGRINEHPDIDEIDKRLKSGESPVLIAGMLQERYPDDVTKWIDNPQLYTRRKRLFPEVNIDHRKNVAPDVGKRIPGGKPRRRKDESDEEEQPDIGKRLMVLTGREPPPPEPRRVITDEKLMNWINGVDGFAQFVDDMIIERGIHVSLQDYQREIAQAFLDYTQVAVCAGAQVGKDFMIMAFSVWSALMNPGSSQLILCATQSQSVALMDRTLENINMDNELAASIAKTARKPDYAIFFKNGSRIYYLTGQSRIAGKTNILIIWVNEARDLLEEEITRASPLLGVAGGRLYVLSRPRFRQGYFWDTYSLCEKNPRFKAMKIPTTRNKYFNARVYEDQLHTLSPDLFKIEYLADFADAGSSYFSEKAIDNCSRSEYDYRGMAPEPEYDYSLGIDWARLRDTCVLTVIGKRRVKQKGEPEFKLFHLFSFSPEGAEPTSFDHHFAYTQVLDNHFQFRHVIPESSGMGIPLSDRLVSIWNADRRGGVVKPYENRSLQSKLDMYDHTKYIIEGGNIILPRNCDRLINELKMTNFGTTLQGTLRIETPITDDYADSLCLALMAWKRPFEIGIAAVKLPTAEPDIYVR